MRPITIVPGHHPGNPDVDPSQTKRWAPAQVATRDVDVPRPSAYAEERRFETIYPGTKSSAEASDAAWHSEMQRQQDHDRHASEPFLKLLNKEVDDLEEAANDTDDSDDDLTPVRRDK